MPGWVDPVSGAPAGGVDVTTPISEYWRGAEAAHAPARRRRATPVIVNAPPVQLRTDCAHVHRSITMFAEQVSVLTSFRLQMQEFSL